MTLALSTSSPLVSAALLDEDGAVAGSMSDDAGHAAGEKLAVFVDLLLAGARLGVNGLDAVAVDIGPGGFTGVKVGVTFAKTLAWAAGKPLVVARSFDLISTDQPVAIPSKKAEWYVRPMGGEPKIVAGERPIGHAGYGPGAGNPQFPTATAFGPLLATCVSVQPELAVPYYLGEPSISVPKDPRVLGRGGL